MISSLMDPLQIEILFKKYLLPFFLKVIGAFLLWFFADLLIRAIKGLLIRTLVRKQVDPTLVTYAKNSVGLALKALAVILILGIFGFETTSFSAILAAAGVAIGVAWSGLLSNFAAGVFLILFRPFKVGDTVSAAGVTGTVREIGLFATIIDNGDNLRYFVGNNKLFSENILNYSSNEYRMATFRIQLDHSVDSKDAIEKIRATLETVEGALQEPPVNGEIVEFNPMGTVIQFKVAAQNRNHSSILNEGNLRIAEILNSERYPAPQYKTLLHSSTGRSEA
ncbi:MAG: mechanosensitive ion channel family protein [Bdellovibrionales bacterium]|nr:mechanosensitive ion channel family protein [Bdellovibrionales bacterium]